jgi:hypothetical protein
MDRKNQIIGTICILCALILLFRLDTTKHGGSVQEERVHQRETVAESKRTKFPRNFTSVQGDEKFSLENNLVRVEFSSNYGAINRVFLKKYKKFQGGEDLVIFNDGGCCPALGLLLAPAGGDEAKYVSGFSVKSFDERSIVFGKVDENGLEIIRSYSLPEKDGNDVDAYVINHGTNLINHSDADYRLKSIGLSLGSIPAMEGDVTGDYLNFGYYNGKSA